MASKQNKKPATRAKQHASAQAKQAQNRRELGGVLCIIMAIFCLICCFDTDAFLIAPTAKLIGGLLGQVGRYLLPAVLMVVGVTLLRGKKKPVRLRIFCQVTLLITLSALVHIFCAAFSEDYGLSIKALYEGGKAWETGGVIPGLLGGLLSAALTKIGGIIVLFLLIVLQFMGCMGITINSLISAIKNRPRLDPEPEEEPEEDPAERLVSRVTAMQQERRERKKATAADIDIPVDDPPQLTEGKKKCGAKKAEPEEAAPPAPVSDEKLRRIDAQEKQVTIDEIELHDPIEDEKPTAPAPEPVQEQPAQEEPRIIMPSGMPELKREESVEKLKKGEAEASAVEVADEIAKNAESPVQQYTFPPMSLLTQRRQSTADATAEMQENSRRLSDTLTSFGVDAHIVNVIRGPSITRYELELDPGVKLSKITNLSDDIALALGASGVRVSAIPDMISVVGIEVPNKIVNVVSAREVIDSPAFRNSRSKISFAVGKDISGNCIVGDISKLPHMLIAGTTGSGKSVCMNTLIVSLLYKAKPDEVKLIMVDPKMVELGVYNGIPHLLIPVVTDPKKAAGALQWTVTEMMRRYRLMSEEGVRDIESYNKAIRSDPEQKPMEQIVVVIDELADLMLVAAKEVEESICRIAQMGRASGIHLVIATQRPSADVITGLMKANIPSRIAFAVSSSMESRIILDTQGAEKLVGKGDMLFAPLGQGKPKRVQGCLITDEEVQQVVAAIKSQCASDYSTEVMEQIEKRVEQGGKGGEGTKSTAQDASDGDELLPQAVEVILETGQASVSMLQRRLKLGYARAARIVDEMEERGIVGPFEGAKPRQLLITKEQWEQMQNGTYVPDHPAVEEEIP